MFDYVKSLKESQPDAKILVVGHSLGGGLAKIVGAKAHVPAVALSGPGIVSTRHKIGVTLTDINRYVTNVVPSHDVVAALGTLGGGIHNVVCDAHRPDICHMPLFTVCKLSQMCGGAAGSLIDTCRFSFEMAFAGEQKKKKTERTEL